MAEQAPERTRPTALKWVSLGLLVLALPVLVVLAGWWVLSSIGGIDGDPDPTSGPAGASLGMVLLGFLAGLAAWVTGCVVRRDPRRGRRAFLAATVAVVVGFVGGVVFWTPVAWQVAHQDDLVADLRQLDGMMPDGYELDESDDGKNAGSGFVEPQRVWSTPSGARPCEQLGPILTRWAGHEPESTPQNRYGVCTFSTTRHGWHVRVRAEVDRGQVELKTSA